MADALNGFLPFSCICLVEQTGSRKGSRHSSKLPEEGSSRFHREKLNRNVQKITAQRIKFVRCSFLVTFAYQFKSMKVRLFFGTLFLLLLDFAPATAQCSICTKTASQLGEGPAAALNSAIIYLALAPFVIVGYLGWRWWKNEKQVIQEEQP
jgi:hypothetical protein